MVENGTGPSNSAERGVNGTRRDEDVAEAGNETENENEDNENNENDEEEEEDDDDDDHEGPYTPFDLPSKKPLRSCGSRKQNSVWVCRKASRVRAEVEASLSAPVSPHLGAPVATAVGAGKPELWGLFVPFTGERGFWELLLRSPHLNSIAVV